MKTFRVRYRYQLTTTELFDVEAENEDEAIRKASDEVESGNRLQVGEARDGVKYLSTDTGFDDLNLEEMEVI